MCVGGVGDVCVGGVGDGVGEERVGKSTSGYVDCLVVGDSVLRVWYTSLPHTYTHTHTITPLPTQTHTAGGSSVSVNSP